MNAPSGASRLQMEIMSYDLEREFSICIPEISNATNISHFLPRDLERVLDFDNIRAPPPKDIFLKVFIREDFYDAYTTCRGAYLIYKIQKAPAGYPAVGCIPMEKTSIEYPPGGRRVFKDHADTSAKHGYEFAIHDAEMNIPDVLKRPTAYIVTESNAQRDEWANAIRVRSELRNRDTKLRPSTRRETGAGGKRRSILDDDAEFDPEWKDGGKPEFLDEATDTFGRAQYDLEDYIDYYFRQNEEHTINEKMTQLEKYHVSVKQGLRGKVLEQYRYFVEASREMTIMGKQVSELREFIDQHLRCIQTMKAIDFGLMTLDEDDEYGSSDEGSAVRNMGMMGDDDDDGGSSVGSSVVSSEEDFTTNSGSAATRRTKKNGNSIKQSSTDANDMNDVAEGDDEKGGGPGAVIEIPTWLADGVEEISTLIRQCQYTDATEKVLKTKAEINEILSMHEKLTTHRLTTKQQTQIQRILQSTINLSSRMGDRLAEGLRRKNEALKQGAKRERSDPLSVLAPILSPICLNDDASALSLLVKLGRTQDAATAYAARRSLLLMESLGERPITSSGTMDVVIYSAQLSQGFFSCLSTSVEGFLDLFLGEVHHDNSIAEDPTEENYSIMTGHAGNKVPAGALASIVLWCDSELSKFAAVFGGNKILGQLALSGPLTIVKEDDDEEKNKEIEAKTKERQRAIEIAAKCVDQAFRLASENLDSIGLPLSPRLADYLRGRLKSCEAEIAFLLKGKWDHIIYDWLTPNSVIEGENHRKGRDSGIRSSAIFDD